MQPVTFLCHLEDKALTPVSDKVKPLILVFEWLQWLGFFSLAQ